LFEAIVQANHRAVMGDTKAGVHRDDFAAELPVVALTCIDPRLNALLPGALGIAAEDFIWLRNAGNIITGPASSTMRSLALACAIKGGRDIAVIGHTDCRVGQGSISALIDKFRDLGVRRELLPENLTEFFGVFASERQNVIKAVDFARSSPLIGPRIPVHGLLLDLTSGKLEWLVNGYQTLEAAASHPSGVPGRGAAASYLMSTLADIPLGDLSRPLGKIGEVVQNAMSFIQPPETPVQIGTPAAAEPSAPGARPGALPIPPPVLAPWLRGRPRAPGKR